MDSVSFHYNGKNSDDLGIYLVKLETNMVRDPFLGEREIISEQIIGNDQPYLYDTKTSPLKATLTLSLLEGLWTTAKRRAIADWLVTENFELFYSTDDINKRYYLMYEDGIDLFTNGNQQGYIEVSFMNISPYTYSPVYTVDHDLSLISVPTTIQFTNDGDTLLKPEIWITKYGAGDFSIKNLTDGNREFKFTGLADQEVVYVDNKDRYIESDIPLTYRYDEFNGNFLFLVKGINSLEVTGSAYLSFRYEYELKG